MFDGITTTSPFLQIILFPFNINSAVDELLKKEFDQYREKKEPHPYIESLGINAIPYQHEDLDKWRHNFTGVQHLHENTNLILHGAIDDVWIDQDSEAVSYTHLTLPTKA